MKRACLSKKKVPHFNTKMPHSSFAVTWRYSKQVYLSLTLLSTKTFIRNIDNNWIFNGQEKSEKVSFIYNTRINLKY